MSDCLFWPMGERLLSGAGGGEREVEDTRVCHEDTGVRVEGSQTTGTRLDHIAVDIYSNDDLL